MAAVFWCVGNAMLITIITTLHHGELGRLRRLIISISTHDHKTSHRVSASHTCPLPFRAHCVGSSIPLAPAISRANNTLPGTATFFDVQTSRSSMVVFVSRGRDGIARNTNILLAGCPVQTALTLHLISAKLVVVISRANFGLSFWR